MEDLLDLYCVPYDPTVPVICMDEQPIQLVKETRVPLSAEPGHVARYDDEYERNGTAVAFMLTEPLGHWRQVSIRPHRTSVDWALEINALLEREYPTAPLVRVVCDNLKTHTIASLYKAFPPNEARRLAQR